ncbi:hypothetical protein BDA99DRAFT_604978 [Phascolomyces articulosus]|uniref:Uncharacterized protein n=1 Tax=Phascolomyces articulosus TaxID=60185 RepID=A0AAD5K0D3_9FUNG|nr:hypothetical protein BDA99DRAFT_604978 [Phascolomyces articulosus]
MADDHSGYFLNHNNKDDNNDRSTGEQPSITSAPSTTATTATQQQHNYNFMNTIHTEEFPFATYGGVGGLVGSMDAINTNTPFPDPHQTIAPSSLLITANNTSNTRATYLTAEEIMALLTHPPPPSSSFHPDSSSATTIDHYQQQQQQQQQQHQESITEDMSYVMDSLQTTTTTTTATPLHSFPIEHFQQQNQWETFLSSISNQEQQPLDDIPHGSPRRRVSYDERLVLPREMNHATTMPYSTLIPSSPTTTLRNLMARRRGRTFTYSSRNRNMITSRQLSIDPPRFQLPQHPHTTTSSIGAVSSPTASINFDSLSIFSPTTTRNPVVSPSQQQQQRPQQRRQQRQGPSQIILTPRDFATSVSLAEQHMVHTEVDGNRSGNTRSGGITTELLGSGRATAIESNNDTTLSHSGSGSTQIIIDTTPESRSVRNYENELRYLRDQWISICIALSSLRNMYLAVSSSSTSFSDPNTSTHHDTITRSSTTPPPAESSRSAAMRATATIDKNDDHGPISTEPSSSTSHGTANEQQQQEFTDFPIPSSVTVTSFIGTTLPLNPDDIPQPPRSKKKKKGGKRGRGAGSKHAYGKRITSLTPRGLHPDIEHEMLIGFDDALLQLRQLRTRIEVLEAEIQRLKGETTSTNNDTSTEDSIAQRSISNSSPDAVDDDEEEEDEDEDEDEDEE